MIQPREPRLAVVVLCGSAIAALISLFQRRQEPTLTMITTEDGTYIAEVPQGMSEERVEDLIHQKFKGREHDDGREF